MHHGQGETDIESAVDGAAVLGGGSEDDQDEDEGQYDLNEQSGYDGVVDAVEAVVSAHVLLDDCRGVQSAPLLWLQEDDG